MNNIEILALTSSVVIVILGIIILGSDIKRSYNNYKQIKRDELINKALRDEE